jgi:hypothetical protein
MKNHKDTKIFISLCVFVSLCLCGFFPYPIYGMVYLAVT